MHRVKLEFLEVGAGVPVVSVHGWPVDHRLMAGCLEPVFAGRQGGGGYRRLYPDLPGMGASGIGGVESSDGMLAALDDFVEEQVGREPFLLVGESYGGYLARALTARRREQVLGLALVCPLVDAVPHEERVLPGRQVLREEAGLLPGDRSEAADMFRDGAVVRTAETLRRFRAEVLPGLDAADVAALARVQRRWRLSEPPERAGGEPFRRPTLILTGRQDDSVGYEQQFALLPHYPRAAFAVLDVAGHNAQYEQPALFEALVGEWLDRVAAEA